MSNKIFTHPVRIYYEDTDHARIVYYANYLKFAERARTEMLREAGINQTELMENDGLAVVVRHVEVDFLKPAKIDDLLQVETTLREVQKLRMTIQQSIRREQETLVKLLVELVCVNRAMKPVKWPETIIQTIKG
jgi:acyl-CoA thioester hydrolase